MEDIYKIQVSVGLNDSIFTKLKELTAALNKADASVVRLTANLRKLSGGMKATGLGAVESASSVLKMGTAFKSASPTASTLNRSLRTTASRLTKVAHQAQNVDASLRGLRSVGSLIPGGAAMAGGFGDYEAVKYTG